MSPFSVRVSVFFAAYFLVVGVYLPYFPVWLEAKGLSAGDIGILIALPMVMRVVFTPLMAVAAGRFALLTRAIAVFSVLGALPIVALLVVDEFWAIFVVIGVSALFWNPILPLAEALTLAGVRRGSVSYGRMRLWGSWSFIAATIAGGWLLVRLDPEDTAAIIVACFALCVAAAFWLREPDHRADAPPVAQSSSLKDTARLFALKPLIFALVAAALVQASHGVLYTFGSVHWAAAGIGYGTIGWLWAIGVLAEIALFAISGPAGRAFGAFGLILLGGIAGVIRWGAFGLDPTLPALIMLQVLHGFTFGAAHLGLVQMIAAAVPERHAAAAQALYFTVGGLTLGLATYVSGDLYGALSAQAYWVMAGLALAGGAIAGVGAIAFPIPNQALTPKAPPQAEEASIR